MEGSFWQVVLVYTDSKYDINTSNKPLPLFGKENFNVNSNPDYSKVKIPEIQDDFQKKKKTAKNDGKFSFLEFGKNIVKGTGQFFVDIFKNIVENPLLSLGVLAVAGAMASTPIGLMILSGCGLMAALFGTAIVAFKSGQHIAGGKWDKLEKEGIEVGKIIMTALTSAFGAIKASKMLTAAASETAATKKAFSISGLWEGIKKRCTRAKPDTAVNNKAFSMSGLWEGIKNLPANAKKGLIDDWKHLWPALKKTFKIDADLTGSLMWRLLKVPFKAVRKPFLSKDKRANYRIFTLKNNKGEGVYQTFVNKNLSRSRVFSDQEKAYLATLADKNNPNRARLFDWTFSAFRKSNNPAIITSARQVGG